MQRDGTSRNSQNTPPKYILKDLDSVAHTAQFFGFTPIKSPDISKDDIKKADSLLPKGVEPTEDDEFFRLEEKIALLRSYVENNIVAEPGPHMLYYRKPMPGASKKRSNMFECGIDILGTANSVAEALSIKTLLSILSELKFDALVVEINTIGDKESIARFEREISSFVRKNWTDIPSDLKPVFKKTPLSLITCIDDRVADLISRAPKPMGYLSEASITHFKEVLEYLETMGILYRINEHLVGEPQFCSQTIFRILGNGGPKKEQQDIVLAHGCRLSNIAKKTGFKRDVPIMSASISFKKAPEVIKKVLVRINNSPRFYFIQLGFRARLKSIEIIDTLRKARIPVRHALMKDKFLNQISASETVGPSHLIIMGQKEAIDNTVVIRNVETRAQDTVTIGDLCTYLQKISKIR
jgi:histidyl-tRNA synthetase